MKHSFIRYLSFSVQKRRFLEDLLKKKNKDFGEIQNGRDLRWRIQDGGYFNVKDVIGTPLLLQMTTYLLFGTRILSYMLLITLVCGYTSNGEEILIKYLFSQYNKINNAVNDVILRHHVNKESKVIRIIVYIILS